MATSTERVKRHRAKIKEQQNMEQSKIAGLTGNIHLHTGELNGKPYLQIGHSFTAEDKVIVGEIAADHGLTLNEFLVQMLRKELAKGKKANI